MYILKHENKARDILKVKREDMYVRKHVTCRLKMKANLFKKLRLIQNLSFRYELPSSFFEFSTTSKFCI